MVVGVGNVLRAETLFLAGIHPARQAAEHEAHMLYRQERRRACGTPVEASVIAGCDAFACPTCQPMAPAHAA